MLHPKKHGSIDCIYCQLGDYNLKNPLNGPVDVFPDDIFSYVSCSSHLGEEVKTSVAH